MGVRVRAGALSIELKASDRSRKINRPLPVRSVRWTKSYIDSTDPVPHTHTQKRNQTATVYTFQEENQAKKPPVFLILIRVRVSVGNAAGAAHRSYNDAAILGTQSILTTDATPYRLRGAP